MNELLAELLPHARLYRDDPLVGGEALAELVRAADERALEAALELDEHTTLACLLAGDDATLAEDVVRLALAADARARAARRGDKAKRAQQLCDTLRANITRDGPRRYLAMAWLAELAEVQGARGFAFEIDGGRYYLTGRQSVVILGVARVTLAAWVEHAMRAHDAPDRSHLVLGLRWHRGRANLRLGTEAAFYVAPPEVRKVRWGGGLTPKQIAKWHAARDAERMAREALPTVRIE